MRQLAWVTEARGARALVEVRRHQACGSCGACLTEGAERRFEARNPLGVPVGTLVAVELTEGSFLAAAALLYLAPLAVGAALAAGVSFAAPGRGDGTLCLAFLAGVAAAFAVLRLLERRGAFGSSFLPVVTGEASAEPGAPERSECCEAVRR